MKKGKIIIPADLNVWPHEFATAKALAKYGHNVEFKKKKEGYKVHSADAYVDKKIWEFKAPKGNKLDAIERNLRRAKKQSNLIVIDSIRMKSFPDYVIKREILAKAPLISNIRDIIFINRKRECIDIYHKK